MSNERRESNLLCVGTRDPKEVGPHSDGTLTLYGRVPVARSFQPARNINNDRRIFSPGRLVNHTVGCLPDHTEARPRELQSGPSTSSLKRGRNMSQSSIAVRAWATPVEIVVISKRFSLIEDAPKGTSSKDRHFS